MAFQRSALDGLSFFLFIIYLPVSILFSQNLTGASPAIWEEIRFFEKTTMIDRWEFSVFPESLNPPLISTLRACLPTLLGGPLSRSSIYFVAHIRGKSWCRLTCYSNANIRSDSRLVTYWLDESGTPIVDDAVPRRMFFFDKWKMIEWGNESSILMLMDWSHEVCEMSFLDYWNYLLSLIIIRYYRFIMIIWWFRNLKIQRSRSQDIGRFEDSKTQRSND